MAIMVLNACVMASYVLGIKSTEAELSALMRGSFEFIAPDIWRPELANTFWKYIQKQEITLEEAEELFRRVETLLSYTVSSQELWSSALLLATRENHSVYDCFYLALAMKEKTKVITYDQALWLKFGELAVSPEEVIA